MRHVEGIPRNQMVLFPECIDDYIDENNPVRFIDEFVDSLDLVKLGFQYAQPKATGRPPYHPRDMLKLYLYGYINRIRSSRWLEKETRRNLEVMWLMRKLTPDFKTIADFRKNNKEGIKKVCKAFILLCKDLGLFGCELVAIDGSKFKAVNAKKRNFNAKKLQRKIRDIEKKIEEYLEALDGQDKEEEEASSMDTREVQEKIEEYKKRREKYKKLLQDLEEAGESQISLTDPDARAMVNHQRIEVCYNVQFTVDHKHKLIVDYEVTQDREDSSHLSTMGKRAKEVLGVEKIEALADKGYYKTVEIKECVEHGIMPYIPEPASKVSKTINIPRPSYQWDKFRYDKERDVYRCPEGKTLCYRGTIWHREKRMRVYRSRECAGCKARGLCTRNKRGRKILRWEHEEVLEAMRERVKKEKEKVEMRKCIIEHVFGTMKRNFNQGYFLTRGKESVSGEMALTVLAYNMKRVMNIVGPEGLREVMEAMKKGIGKKSRGIFFSIHYFLTPIQKFSLVPQYSF